jgi:hypothetical protein
MDATRFDDLLRSLTAASSRRAFARIVVGLAMGAAGAAAVTEAEAEKKTLPAVPQTEQGQVQEEAP